MDARSRLPKPTGIPFTKLNYAMLPKFESRHKSELTGAITHGTQVRGGSPDLFKPTTMIRAKLRRSRSACDLRENASRPLFKRTEPTLSDIPAKSSKLTTSTSSLNTLGSNHNFAANRGILKPLTNTVKKINSAPSVIASSSLANKAKPTTTTTTTKTTGAVKSVGKRIPPYDYKARFNDLVEKHKILKEKFEKQREQLGHLDTLPDLYEESQAKLGQCEQDLKLCENELECVRAQNKKQHDKIESLTYSLKTATEDRDLYKTKSAKLTKENDGFLIELKKLRHENENFTDEVEFLKHELQDCKDQLFRANYERKELHNVVMDLRGNIRVFCRVRPPLTNEEDRGMCKLTYLDECSLEICNNDFNTNKLIKHDFSFDQVFHARSRQEDIFEMVSPLIQSALDGYNVCIFAYGQTGSGKTYTMDGVSDNLGIIPRTVDLLFESVTNYKRLGWDYQMKATFLEIYNETLYDLLNPRNTDLEIRMANARCKTDVYVSNLTEEIVTSGGHLKDLMNLARSNRATAATVGNERSSRSHAVTRIQLIGTHDLKGESSIGTINLVDLAGSESPKTSIRMDETKNINRSLSELTNVVLALLQKQEHIPFRNSKLTYLLMPSLGGNSKTLMFINIAPFQDCFVESVKSLRFAASVNSCKLNKAKKNRILNSSSSF